MEECVFGGVLTARANAIRKVKGETQLKELVELMAKRGYFEPDFPDNIKGKKRYQMDFMIGLLETYRDLFGEEAFGHMCRKAAHQKGIFGFFLRWAGSPKILMNNAENYWGEFFTFGRLVGTYIEDGKGYFRGYGLSPKPIFCESLTHWCMGIFDTVGTNVEVEHFKCEHRGDDYCEWTVEW